MDPHAPYSPPADEPAADFRHDEPLPIDAGRVGVLGRLSGLTDGREYIDRYDEEIAYADREIGRLLKAYTDLGLTESTLFLFTADHGETMVEHEVYFSHGYHVWEAIMHVPLALRRPGGEPRRIAHPVSLVDVFPELLASLGLPVPPGLDGVPLSRRRPGDALSLEVSGWHEYQVRALLSGQRKWFLTSYEQGAIGERWYVDLDADPAELTHAAWPGGAEEQTLLGWLRDDPDPAGRPADLIAGQHLIAPKVAPGVTPQQIEALRGLGYVE